ncbi:MAG: hypothetical protein E6J57_02270 [Deltaproteobacteria bacterium]|nr:MAG: hypothetical protein E6J57_02270 [Deltaproteobacteria bacterium]
MASAQAAVLNAVREPLSVEPLAVRDPRDGEVLVRLGASGVCHSDLHAITGDLPMPLPCVLGHEGAGVVEKVGAGVQRVKPKDHVVLNWVPFCGSCWYGSAYMARDVPRLIDLYRAGKLKLDELITRRYKIAQVNDAFAAMEKGEVARGVITS